MINPYAKFMGSSESIFDGESQLNEPSSIGAGKYEQIKTDLTRNPNPDNRSRFAAVFAQIDALAD